MPPRKSSTRKRQRGRGVIGDIHNFVRDNQLISKGIRLAGHPEIADTVAQTGYGRKRKGTRKSKGSLGARTVIMAVPIKKRATRRKTQRGRGIFDSIGRVLGSVGHGVGSAGYGILSGLTGGRRRGTRKRGGIAI